jgi:Ca-activated chloride channel family protein
MKSKQIKPIILIGCLIAVTCFAMASSKNLNSTIVQTPHMEANINETVSKRNGIVTLSANLVQNKIVTGSDGIVSLALTMTADPIRDVHPSENQDSMNNVDMVIVLDCSGSMSGQKINDARKASIELVSRLKASDRFALVTYSNNANVISGLVHVTPAAKNRLNQLISSIYAGGGTNLGEGLQSGIEILTTSVKNGNSGRLILISDGLANKGITGIDALGNMASMAVKNEFSISSAGVGNDFNEDLMTAIADYGTGNYYFMENPSAFAAVFNNEFNQTRTAAATGVKVSFKEKNGIKLIDAGGYPIESKNNTAEFFPGDLMSGQTRKLFLNLQVPTDQVSAFDISGISLQYNYNETPYLVKLAKPLKLACIKDHKAAIASIDKITWENKVLKDDFSRLKEAVAGDIKSGRKEEAFSKIEQYQSEQQAINASVQSEAVAENLDHDLNQLRDTVDETFTGKPSAVAEKQKKNAKVMQYEGYRDRRKN